MKHRFYWGPDKLPFDLHNNGMVQATGAMPFHGIISRGLLEQFRQHQLSADLWHRYAAVLPGDSIDHTDLETIRLHAKECAVLSFEQSAVCARYFLEEYYSAQDTGNASVEAWNIKEGHTSSVWKITCEMEDRRETFVLNISRDRQAGIELRNTSEKLKTIGEQVPGIRMAKVYTITSLSSESLPCEVVLTMNEWIPDAYEVHTRTNQRTGGDEYLVVERFLTSSADPAKILSVKGRVLSEIETTLLRSQLDEFLNLAATCLPGRPSVAINDGDVVWDGEKAIVVALS
jgi:hypothetical protein